MWLGQATALDSDGVGTVKWVGQWRAMKMQTLEEDVSSSRAAGRDRSATSASVLPALTQHLHQRASVMPHTTQSRTQKQGSMQICK